MTPTSIEAKDHAENTAVRLPVEWAQLQVYVPLVRELGEGPAIVLHQIIYLTRGERARLIDGRRWIFYSYRTLAEKFFPWWTHAGVQLHIKALLDRGLLLTRNDLNREPYDRTQWYAINWVEVAKLGAYTVELSPGQLEPEPVQFKASDTDDAADYRYIHAGLAAKLGLGPSLLLRHLLFMLGPAGRYAIDDDGARWIHEGAKHLLASYFPWWSERTIRRHFADLRRRELIEERNEERGGVPWLRLNRKGMAGLDVDVPASWYGEPGDTLQGDAKTLQPLAKSLQGDAKTKHPPCQKLTAPLPELDDNTIDSLEDSIEDSTVDSQERETAPQNEKPGVLTLSPETDQDGVPPVQDEPDPYMHPAVAYLVEKGSYPGNPLALPLGAAQQIAGEVPAANEAGLERWQQAVDAALAGGVQPANVACMLDWYRDPKRRYSKRTVGRQGSASVDADPDKRRRDAEEIEARKAAWQEREREKREAAYRNDVNERRADP